MRHVLMRVGESLGCVRESWTLKASFFGSRPSETIVHRRLCKTCFVMRGASLVLGSVALIMVLGF